MTKLQTTTGFSEPEKLLLLLVMDGLCYFVPFHNVSLVSIETLVIHWSLAYKMNLVTHHISCSQIISAGLCETAMFIEKWVFKES